MARARGAWFIEREIYISVSVGPVRNCFGERGKCPRGIAGARQSAGRFKRHPKIILFRYCVGMIAACSAALSKSACFIKACAFVGCQPRRVVSPMCRLPMLGTIGR